MIIKDKILKAMDGFMQVLKEKTLQTLEEVDASNGEECWAGAGAVAELNNKLANGRVELVISDDGTIGYKLDGADTVHPFRSTVKLTTTLRLSCTNNYNFGDVKTVECNILISPSGIISVTNNHIIYNFVDAAGKQGGADVILTNTKVSFI